MVRRGTAFDRPQLDNAVIIGQYPRKKFFLYEYDEPKPPLLRPFIPDEAVRSGG